MFIITRGSCIIVTAIVLFINLVIHIIFYSLLFANWQPYCKEPHVVSTYVAGGIYACLDQEHTEVCTSQRELAEIYRRIHIKCDGCRKIRGLPCVLRE